MARYTGPKCRLCRREGTKLFLKGPKCDSPKCPVSRRATPPGDHAWRRPRFSEYRVQLREKQRAKRFFGLLERQFKTYYSKSDMAKGNTGENLLLMLERRLDNVVFHLGFAASRGQARQLVTHGHILVNGRKVDRPSVQVRIDDKIQVKDKPKSRDPVKANYEMTEGREAPKWLTVDKASFIGRVIALPTRSDVSLPIQEQFIVELCSK